MKYKYLIYFSLLTIFSGHSFADSNGIWTHVEDIRPGVFGGDEATASENYTFDNVVYFNKNIFSDSIISTSDPNYMLNLSGVSNIHRVVANKYFSNGSTIYYLDPAQISRVNNLEVVNTLLYKGQELDLRYVNENQPNSITSGMIIDGTVVTSDLNLANIDSRYATKSYVDSRIPGSVPVRQNVGGQISSNNYALDINYQTSGKGGTTFYHTFYLANQNTANYLCNRITGKPLGIINSYSLPPSSWQSNSNLAITASNDLGGSYRIPSGGGGKGGGMFTPPPSPSYGIAMCVSGSDCFNKKVPYITSLSCFSFT